MDKHLIISLKQDLAEKEIYAGLVLDDKKISQRNFMISALSIPAAFASFFLDAGFGLLCLTGSIVFFFFCWRNKKSIKEEYAENQNEILNLKKRIIFEEGN